jgi:hypothetical protein
MLAAMIVCIGVSAFAAPYVGISQGSGATSVELGFLTKSFEENVFVGVPSIVAMDSFEPEFYKTIVVGTDLVYRFPPIGERVVIGFGPTFRFGFEAETALALMAGVVFQISLERPSVMDILYLEGAYVPDFLVYENGTASGDLLEHASRQWLRIGWRHAF